MGQEPPAPVIGRQDRERLIHEHAAALRGGELAAVVVEVVEGLDVVDELPGFARAEDRHREGERVEGHVVLAHELGVADVIGALVGAPPAFPAGALVLAGVVPFLGAGDVFDGRVEPDVEDLALHARPGRGPAPDGHAPGEVAGDAAVLQTFAVVEPFARDRGGEHGPVGLAVDPGGELAAHRGLAQVEVARLAHLEPGRAGDRGARVDEVGGVELLGAVLALVAAGAVVAAVRAGALDVAVGQEAVVVDREDLAFGDLGDEAGIGEAAGEVLGQAVVLRRGGAAEMVEGESEAAGEVGLNLVHLGAVVRDGLAGLGGGKLGRGAVFVGGAEKEHLVPAAPQVAGIEVGGKLGAYEIAEVLDPVDVGDGGGDEVAGHRRAFRAERCGLV